MLSELNMVGNWFKNEPESGWNFDELKFDDGAKTAFESLELDIEVFNYSARVNIATNKNHCYIPSHYFLYALKLQPLVLLVSRYMDVFDQVTRSLSTAVDFDNLITNSTPSNPITNALDTYSRDNFFNVFRDDSYRLGAKSIINNDTKKGKKYRSQDDFVRSIILKALPVPDASSGMLGSLIYAFSQNPNSYKTLADKCCSHIPQIFRSTSGDDLLFMILSTLGWEDKLDHLIVRSSGRIIDWGDIPNAFLMSPTPVSGNALYVDKPVHYSHSLNEYVHIKKDLLSTEELQKKVSMLISALWPNMIIQQDGSEFFFKSSTRVKIETPKFEGATNRIFYGAPGTGKSYKIHTEESNGAEKFVTVFHPDTQYNDFVGALKPKMEKDSHGKQIVTYQFRPGPFTNALVKAKIYPELHVCLIIEEINRAPAAAVFGELFQLLDRNKNGESTYKIDAADPDMLMYINEQLSIVGFPELTQLEIPANLSLLATMNSSDQSVMPMDTAFKRRWSFKYVKIDFDNENVPNNKFIIPTRHGNFDISWSDFAQIINKTLIESHVAEDRLLGPFFLNENEMADEEGANDTLCGKLFVYLWDDVLRHLGHGIVFSPSYKIFGDLSNAFYEGKPIFNLQIEDGIEEKGKEVITEDSLGEIRGE